VGNNATEKEVQTPLRVEEIETLRVEIVTVPVTAEARAALRRFLSDYGAHVINRMACKKRETN
jgi:hypothetical protein